MIGFLLGTGGTLLTSSFWLSATDEAVDVVLQSTDDPSPTNGDAMAAHDIADPVTTQVAAHNDDGLRTSPQSGDDGHANDERVAYEVAPVQADGSYEGVKESDSAKAPVTDETLPPSALPDTVAGAGEAADRQAPAATADERPAGTSSSRDSTSSQPPTRGLDLRKADPPSGSLSPEDAVAALVEQAETSPRSPNAANEPTLDQGAVSDHQAEAVNGRRQEPIPVPAAALRLDNDQISEPDPLQEAMQALQSRSADDSELPSRVKQGLFAGGPKADGVSGADARGNRLYRVQLAAVDDEVAARLYWREINERLPGVFADVEPIFDQREIGQRLFLRIWVGAFDRSDDASTYCGWLKEQGQDCFVTRVDNL